MEILLAGAYTSKDRVRGEEAAGAGCVDNGVGAEGFGKALRLAVIDEEGEQSLSKQREQKAVEGPKKDEGEE